MPSLRTTGPAKIKAATSPWAQVLPLLDVRWARFAAAVVLGALALGSSVALAGASAWLIARASQMPYLAVLTVAIVSVRALGLSRAVFRYAERCASHGVALAGLVNLRANLYERLAAGDYAQVARVKPGELLARVGVDVDEVGNFVVRVLVPAAVAIVVGIGSSLVIGWMLPAAGFALFGCLLVAGVGCPLLTARAARVTEARAVAARGEVAAATMTIMMEGPQLAVSGGLGQWRTALTRAEDQLAAANRGGALITSGGAAMAALAPSLAVLATLILAAAAVASGDITPVQVAVIVLTPMAVFEVTSPLTAAALQWRRSTAAATRVAALLAPPSTAAFPDHLASPNDARQRTLLAIRRSNTEGPLDISGPSPTHAMPGANAIAPVHPLLRARDLTVGWPGSRPVVSGLELQVISGELLTLTGPSGAGKTTLLMTLAGLLPPEAGIVEGVPSRERLFAAEDAHIFATTVFENLRVADGRVSRETAATVLAVVGLADWLAALPAGLDTSVGGNGADVSGGERRRLLIARALLSPAKVLLLDEPTEHLDTAHANLIWQALTNHATQTNRAIIAATHTHHRCPLIHRLPASPALAPP